MRFLVYKTQNFSFHRNEIKTFTIFVPQRIKMEKNFVEELRWRGMLQDIMPGTEELLNKEMVTGYIGFDPTSNS